MGCVTHTVKHGSRSVMIWSFFSSYGAVKLVFIKGIMRKKQYLDILKTSMLESAAMLGLADIFILQQDNDPKHTARIVTNWLHENGIDKFPWVSQSPDLNPIENLWEMVGRRINRSAISRISDLKSEIQKAWYSIPKEVCENLVDSMGKRLEAVIINKGGPTKY